MPMRRRRSLPTLLVVILCLLVRTAPVRAEATKMDVPHRVMVLTRATSWTRIAAIPFRFRTFHPQGMVKIGENFYVSSVEVRAEPKKLSVPRDGHSYQEGVGVGHLFKVGPDGALLADLILGEGSIYHPGGIDYDGTSIWVPVSQYRPDSRAIVYKVAPSTMTATVAFRVADHIGSIVHDRDGRQVIGVTWGSRHFYAWSIAGDGSVSEAGTATPIANLESYIDYQDCHYAGTRMMLCAGLAEYRVGPSAPIFALGGLDLIDLATFRPSWQTPIALWAPSGRAMTQNPFWVEATVTGLRAYFLPDDDNSTMFVFDTVTPAAGSAVASDAAPGGLSVEDAATLRGTGNFRE